MRESSGRSRELAATVVRLSSVHVTGVGRPAGLSLRSRFWRTDNARHFRRSRDAAEAWAHVCVNADGRTGTRITRVRAEPVWRRYWMGARGAFTVRRRLRLRRRRREPVSPDGGVLRNRPGGRRIASGADRRRQPRRRRPWQGGARQKPRKTSLRRRQRSCFVFCRPLESPETDRLSEILSDRGRCGRLTLA